VCRKKRQRRQSPNAFFFVQSVRAHARTFPAPEQGEVVKGGRRVTGRSSVCLGTSLGCGGAHSDLAMLRVSAHRPTFFTPLSLSTAAASQDLCAMSTLPLLRTPPSLLSLVLWMGARDPRTRKGKVFRGSGGLARPAKAGLQGWWHRLRSLADIKLPAAPSTAGTRPGGRAARVPDFVKA